MNIKSRWFNSWRRLGLRIDKARIIFGTTATDPSARVAVLILKSRWDWPRNLTFSLVFFIVAVAFSILSWILAAPHPTLKLWLTVVLFAALFCEVVSVVVSLGWFLLSHISLSGKEQADLLFSKLSKQDRDDCLSRFSHSTKEKEDKAVQSCLDLVTSKYCLAAQMVDRFTFFGGVWLRVWLAFASGSICLSMLQKIAACPVPVFGAARYDLSLSGIASLIEQSIYHSLVTISTVGYGDFAPVTLAGRVLVVWQILTTLAVLTFGLNILVGLILESSALAWGGRRDTVFEFLLCASSDHGGP
jgi:hypothetical protein